MSSQYLESQLQLLKILTVIFRDNTRPKTLKYDSGDLYDREEEFPSRTLIIQFINLLSIFYLSSSLPA